jgi:hypothetical protein
MTSMNQSEKMIGLVWAETFVFSTFSNVNTKWTKFLACNYPGKKQGLSHSASQCMENCRGGLIDIE